MNEKIAMKYCDGFAMCEHNGLIIIANTVTGLNFKMTKECFEILDRCISHRVTFEEFYKWFQDPEDCEYFKKILEVIVKYGIIVPENHKDKMTITLEITNRCNLRCRHCCMDASPVSEDTDLSTEEWKQIIDKFMPLDLEYLTITGGEPLVRQDIFEIAAYAKETLGIPLQLMSNATLINENNADRLLELFDDFSFSLDGADEKSCSAVRGQGVFERAMKAINLMKSKGMKHFSLSLTEVKQNKDSVDDFIKLAEEMGAEPIIRNFDVVGRAKEHLELLPEDVDAAYLPFLPPYPDGKDYFPPNDMPMCISCGAMEKKMAIGHDGTLYPCISMLHPQFRMGNIKDIDDFGRYIVNKEYMATDGYQFFCNMHPARSEECSSCPVRLFCDSCVQYTFLMKHHPKCSEFCEVKRRELIRVWQ